MKPQTPILPTFESQQAKTRWWSRVPEIKADCSKVWSSLPFCIQGKHFGGDWRLLYQTLVNMWFYLSIWSTLHSTRYTLSWQHGQHGPRIRSSRSTLKVNNWCQSKCWEEMTEMFKISWEDQPLCTCSYAEIAKRNHSLLLAQWLWWVDSLPGTVGKGPLGG